MNHPRRHDWPQPMSIDRRDNTVLSSSGSSNGYAVTEVTVLDGGPRAAGGRYAQWTDGGQAPAPRQQQPAHRRSHNADRLRALEDERDDTRALLVQYKSYIDGTLLRDVEALEARLAAATARADSCERDNLSLRAAAARAPSHILASLAERDEALSRLRSESAGKTAHIAQLQAEVSTLRVQSQGNGPDSGRSSSSAADLERELDDYLGALAADADKYAAAVSSLAKQTTEGDTAQSVCSAAGQLRDVWRHVSLSKGTDTTTAPARAEALAALLAAQRQERMLMLGLAATLSEDGARLIVALHTLHAQAAKAQAAAQARARELDEDHHAEVDTLRYSLQRLQEQLSAGSRGGGTASPTPMPRSPLALADNRRESSYAGSTTSPRMPGGLSLAGPGHDAESQTPLSLDFVTGALAAAAVYDRGFAVAAMSTTPPLSPSVASPNMASEDRSFAFGSSVGRGPRRERETEVLSMLLTEVERLREALAAVTAERNLLAEQRERFLGQVESPQLNYGRRLALAGSLGNVNTPV